MLIEIEDLEVGDEILTGAGTAGKLRYLRVLRKPAVGKKVHWCTKRPMYKSVLCTMNIEVFEKSMTHNGHTRKWNEKIFKCTGEGHNTEVRQDLNGKTIWLLKRI